MHSCPAENRTAKSAATLVLIFGGSPAPSIGPGKEHGASASFRARPTILISYKPARYRSRPPSPAVATYARLRGSPRGRADRVFRFGALAVACRWARARERLAIQYLAPRSQWVRR